MAVSRIQASEIQEVVPDNECIAATQNNSGDREIRERNLDLHELLNTVVGVIRSGIDCGGIEYTCGDIDLYYVDGELEESSANYSLSMNSQQLGDIRFTRKSPFHADELKNIEHLLAGLIEPLQHALGFYHDMNCYVNNGTRYYERLQMEVERCQRTGRALSIIKVVPVDHTLLFAPADDWFDEDAVINLIDSIDKHSRRIDTVYRLAEDEYIVLLPHTDSDIANFVSERLVSEVLSNDIDVCGDARKIQLCCGVATYEPGDDAVSIINRAEQEMLRAKIRHNGQVRLVTGEVNMPGEES